MAAPFVGKQSTYDFSTGVKLNIDEAIFMRSVMESPMITGMGADGLAVISTMPVDQVMFSTLSEEALVPRAALSANVLVGATSITVAANDRARFAVGDILKVLQADSTEVMRVDSYGAAGVLNVTRAWGGTTAKAYTSGDIVVAIGRALAEGSDPGDARSRDRDSSYNYTQIFGPEKVSITRTEQGRSKYGVSDEFAHQTNLRLAEMTIQREHALVYGIRYIDTVNKLRTSGGLDWHLTTNVDDTSTQLTIAAVNSMMEDCYDAGGVPDRLMAKPSAFTHINDSSNSSVLGNQTIDDARRGRVIASYVITDYGNVTIVRNRYLSGSDAYLFRREGVIRRVFDPVIIEPLAKTGDSQNLMIVCEEGTMVKGEAHMGKFTNLGYATTASN